ncbi:MAG: hypothetical protein J5597_05220 [Spirochaetaceae bacterium]|nr:hypothetical protein [Spirochaetaceae bacterium]
MFHVLLLWLIIIGGTGLLCFLVIFYIEMRQDFGRIPYYERQLRETIPYNPENQYAVIKSSICTGEKIAGFKDKNDGHFTEVMLIRSTEEEQRFKKIYNLETIKTEY